LNDPENGDYSLADGSPTIGYGCQTFSGRNVVCESSIIEKSQSKTFRQLHSHPAVAGWERERMKFGNKKNRDFIEVSGPITEDTLWDADTVKVIGDLRILNDVTLTIQPGTYIEFQGYFKMKISGTINVVGTPEERITFTSNDPENFVIDASHTGCWQGIRLYDISSINDTSIFEYCIFEYSKATDDSERYYPFAGGAISIYDFSKLIISNNIFRNNVADFGGAILCSNYSAPVIVNNLFYENYGLFSGSTIYNSYSYPKIINNTIVNNSCLNDDIFVNTGTIMNFISKPLIVNNIIWNNPDNYFIPGEFWENKIYYTHNNDIEGYESENNNIDFEPSFSGDEEFPYSLTSHSPCINAGTLDFGNYYLPELDLAGNPRISDEQIDIGAFEFQPETDIEKDEFLISNIKIKNCPNPFHSSTTISFDITSENGEDAEIFIYNLKGQKIKPVKNFQIDKSSNQQITWNGRDENGNNLSSGIYFLRIETGNFSRNHKMVLLRE